MKIVCTLREFELLIARCPMYNYLLGDEKSGECLEKCFEHCVLSGICKADSDSNWSFSDMVEIVHANNL